MHVSNLSNPYEEQINWLIAYVSVIILAVILASGYLQTHSIPTESTVTADGAPTQAAEAAKPAIDQILPTTVAPDPNAFQKRLATTTKKITQPKDGVEPMFRLSMHTSSIVKIAPVIGNFSSLSLANYNTTAEPYVVILDPGHGGTDPGTVGAAGLLEKYLTLDIAHRVAKLLDTNPHIQIKLTRNKDRGFSRNSRLRRIKSKKADLLVSLHFNNLPQPDLTLVESFYAGPENILESELGLSKEQAYSKVTANDEMLKSLDFTRNSKSIANLLQEKIFHEVAKYNPDAINAGVKKDTLFILTQSYIPGTLIELGCLSNTKEEQRLDTASYKQGIASAIASGLIEYFTELDTDQGI